MTVSAPPLFEGCGHGANHGWRTARKIWRRQGADMDEVNTEWPNAGIATSQQRDEFNTGILYTRVQPAQSDIEDPTKAKPAQRRRFPRL